jgi:hypothetical protein
MAKRNNLPLILIGLGLLFLIIPYLLASTGGLGGGSLISEKKLVTCTAEVLNIKLPYVKPNLKDSSTGCRSEIVKSCTFSSIFSINPLYLTSAEVSVVLNGNGITDTKTGSVAFFPKKFNLEICVPKETDSVSITLFEGGNTLEAKVYDI